MFFVSVDSWGVLCCARKAGIGVGGGSVGGFAGRGVACVRRLVCEVLGRMLAQVAVDGDAEIVVAGKRSGSRW